MEDIGLGARFVNEEHLKWPHSVEPNETGFNIADPFYIHLGKDKKRSRRFGNGMRFVNLLSVVRPSEIGA